jgi:hypothetical protein
MPWYQAHGMVCLLQTSSVISHACSLLSTYIVAEQYMKGLHLLIEPIEEHYARVRMVLQVIHLISYTLSHYSYQGS